MNNLISFLVSEEAILVYIVAFVISIVYIIFYFLKKTRHERKKRQNTMELKRLAEEIREEEKKSMKKEVSLTKKASVMPTLAQNNVEVEEKGVSFSEIKEEVMPIKEIVKEEKQGIESIPVMDAKAIEISKKEMEEVVTPKEEIKEVKQVERLVNSDDRLEEALRKVRPSVVVIPTKPVITPEVIEEVPISIVPLGEVELKKDISTSNILYTDTKPRMEDAKKELEEVKEKLENNELDKNIQLTEFERMQEDTAIISLDELMKKAGELYEKNEEVQYKDEGNEPISLEDLEQRKKSISVSEVEEKQEIKENSMTLDDLYSIKITPVVDVLENKDSSEHKFKSSPVISPVYGIKNDEKLVSENTNIELENTANYEKLDEEIRKTNEFIATLRELQKKLD